MRENLLTRKDHKRLAVRKYSCVKISMFTVYKYNRGGHTTDILILHLKSKF